MAFDAVFAVFALSMVVIAVLAVRWAVGRDRAERERRAAGAGEDSRPGPGGRGPVTARPQRPAGRAGPG